jgi:winged helix DNA-binding protein
MRRISLTERRARLGVKHRLAASAAADGPLAVARSLVALHGTDPASVFLAIVPRMREPTVHGIEQALYEERMLVRMLGMRRTMFVVPVVQAACTRAIAVKQRQLYTEIFKRAAFTDDLERWTSEVEESTLRALARRGEATAVELSKDEPRLKQQILLAEGKPYEALQSVSTRVLFLLAAEGRIMRARPRGSWISSQYRWAPTSVWLTGELAELATAEAQVELVRQWLGAFGPGTRSDLRWWTGLTAGEINRALKQIQTVTVNLDGATGLVLVEDAEPPETPEPWVALLPALDPTPMGWNARAWFLGEYAPILFDRSGNIGPTLWSDGRVIGGWAQRKNGEIALRLLEDVGADARSRVESAAEALRKWIGEVRVTPRFRTPLERELSA